MTQWTRRTLLKCSAVAGGSSLISTSGPLRAAHSSNPTALASPSPLFEKPASIGMEELRRQKAAPVGAWQVNDYVPGRYTGPLVPSPPHADLNPKKAVVVQWRDSPCRLVFSHEASYCPYLELPSGAGMGSQFFEGNLGDAELFNSAGRKERNSFVDVIESSHQRAWVRWNYLAVNKDNDASPRLRGTEDYFAYPNGLTLRRATYESLMPDTVEGYSTQPVELFGIVPAGAHFSDLLHRDAQFGDCAALSIVDLYSDLRYDIYWDDKGGVRRNGDNQILSAVNASPGVALAIPFRERLLFAVLGESSGFPRNRSQLVDHCTPAARAAGGIGWQQASWDHWPIGWANSQGSNHRRGSPYPSHFGSIGQFLVPPGKRIRSIGKDYFDFVKDMDSNRWTATRVYYVLLGSAKNWAEIRRIGRTWLDRGVDCARPESISDLA